MSALDDAEKKIHIQNLIKQLAQKDLSLEEYRPEVRKIYYIFENVYDLIRCGLCGRIGICVGMCDFCEIASCDDCNGIKKYDSWNLSGCAACNGCADSYCTNCRSLKKECQRYPSCEWICPKCKSRRWGSELFCNKCGTKNPY